MTLHLLVIRINNYLLAPCKKPYWQRQCWEWVSTFGNDGSIDDIHATIQGHHQVKDMDGLAPGKMSDLIHHGQRHGWTKNIILWRNKWKNTYSMGCDGEQYWKHWCNRLLQDSCPYQYFSKSLQDILYSRWQHAEWKPGRFLPSTSPK